MKKLILFLIVLLLLTGCSAKKEEEPIIEDAPPVTENEEQEPEKYGRPYAVSINNLPIAVKCQTGLSDAYMIYEVPVEAGLTRLLCFFEPDKLPEKIGTVRSARHYFFDFVLEHDAILVHYGASKYYADRLKEIYMPDIDGNKGDPGFWRENPFGLATEHTVYTNMHDIKDLAVEKDFYQETYRTKPVVYSEDEIDLSKYESAVDASYVYADYSSYVSTELKYDEEDQRYYRYSNGVAHKDRITGEHYSFKNIIVFDVDYGHMDDGKNLDMHYRGVEHPGYYITNGKAVPIICARYEDMYTQPDYFITETGESLKINEGNTFVIVHPEWAGLELK